MFITDDIKLKIKQLSILSRKVYGIREKESISFRKHPKFVSDIIKDMTNISYNLAIADHVNSKDEKDLLLCLKMVNRKFNKTFLAQTGMVNIHTTIFYYGENCLAIG